MKRQASAVESLSVGQKFNDSTFGDAPGPHWEVSEVDHAMGRVMLKALDGTGYNADVDFDSFDEQVANGELTKVGGMARHNTEKTTMNRNASLDDRLSDVRRRIQAARAAGPGRRVAGDDNPFADKDDEKDDEAKEARRRVRAEADPDEEAQLQSGNLDELASPSTTEVAGSGNMQLDEKQAMEYAGSSTAPVTEVLSRRRPGRFADVVIDTLRRRNAALAARNRSLTQQIQAIRQKERVAAANGLAQEMFRKGMFRSAGAHPNQVSAARREAARLASLDQKSFVEAARMVKAAPDSTSVPEWTRRVPTGPRQGAVRAPVTAAAVSGDESNDLASMFDRGYR